MAILNDRPLRDILARKPKAPGEDGPHRDLSTDAQPAQGRRRAEHAGADLSPNHLWTELASASQ
ncbi:MULTISPECIES: hypothetical protein [Streptomyces]|nr:MULTISPECIES: hypothetical protein [Streptomyces]SHN21131.1 hypothetical protein SAMN05216268_12423 [Streptomyces yunnanensis]